MELGEKPEIGLIIEPLSPEGSSSERCCIFERIERNKENKRKEQTQTE